MKKIFSLLFLLLGTACALPAQTIIDLGPGGGVRARGTEENSGQPAASRTAADSLRWRDCLVRGLNALGSDSLDRAEKLFDEALRLFPDAQASAVVRHNLGRISMARGDYRRAARMLTEALRTNSVLHQARMDRATCYLELGNTKDALADVNNLLDNPSTGIAEAELYFLRAAIHVKDRLYAEARKDLEQVLRLEPGNVNAGVLLAITDEKDGRPGEAAERLNLLIQAHPESADALTARANLEAKLGHYETARADYDAAVRLQPADAGIRIGRAETLVRLGLKTAARKDLDEAVRLGIPRAALQDLYHQTK